MSTSHSPIEASTLSVVGEPLTNCRLLPEAEKLRLRNSWFSSHGSMPFCPRCV